MSMGPAGAGGRALNCETARRVSQHQVSPPRPEVAAAAEEEEEEDEGVGLRLSSCSDNIRWKFPLIYFTTCCLRLFLKSSFQVKGREGQNTSLPVGGVFISASDWFLVVSAENSHSFSTFCTKSNFFSLVVLWFHFLAVWGLRGGAEGGRGGDGGGIQGRGQAV